MYDQRLNPLSEFRIKPIMRLHVRSGLWSRARWTEKARAGEEESSFIFARDGGLESRGALCRDAQVIGRAIEEKGKA